MFKTLSNWHVQRCILRKNKFYEPAKEFMTEDDDTQELSKDPKLQDALFYRVELAKVWYNYFKLLVHKRPTLQQILGKGKDAWGINNWEQR